MTISPVSSFSPYVYNTNTLSAGSLNKIKPIEDDALASKTDVSALTQNSEAQETTNPLKRGESLDFQGILDMQMQMGKMNASRVMQEAPKPEAVENAQATQAVTPDNPLQANVIQPAESNRNLEGVMGFDAVA